MNEIISVTECCGAEPVSNGDSDSMDWGLCPACHDHCEYIDVCVECSEEECQC